MTGKLLVDLNALSDLCTPWCLHVAVTLRIAELIHAGNQDIDSLAQAAGCDVYALHRVLTHLSKKGVFEEAAQGHFTLNEAALALLDPGMRLGLDLEGIGGRMAWAWGTLLQYVRTGKSAYHEVFGLPFFEDLQAHPQVAASFDTLIGPIGHGIPNPDFQISGGWEGVKRVVDVGGGTGAMLAEILRLRPHVQGTLVDLSETVKRSEAVFQAAGVGERAMAVGQSFFEPLPEGADIYLLRGILNDWPDREAGIILRRCAEAARPDGRVVVLKSVSADETPRDLVIEMVLLGGKHRNLKEFRELARQAELEVTAAEQQAAYFVVECRPEKEMK